MPESPQNTEKSQKSIKNTKKSQKAIKNLKRFQKIQKNLKNPGQSWKPYVFRNFREKSFAINNQIRLASCMIVMQSICPTCYTPTCYKSPTCYRFFGDFTWSYTLRNTNERTPTCYSFFVRSFVTSRAHRLYLCNFKKSYRQKPKNPGKS